MLYQKRLSTLLRKAANILPAGTDPVADAVKNRLNRIVADIPGIQAQAGSIARAAIKLHLGSPDEYTSPKSPQPDKARDLLESVILVQVLLRLNFPLAAINNALGDDTHGYNRMYYLRDKYPVLATPDTDDLIAQVSDTLRLFITQALNPGF